MKAFYKTVSILAALVLLAGSVNAQSGFNRRFQTLYPVVDGGDTVGVGISYTNSEVRIKGSAGGLNLPQCDIIGDSLAFSNSWKTGYTAVFDSVGNVLAGNSPTYIAWNETDLAAVDGNSVSIGGGAPGVYGLETITIPKFPDSCGCSQPYPVIWVYLDSVINDHTPGDTSRLFAFFTTVDNENPTLRDSIVHFIDLPTDRTVGWNRWPAWPESFAGQYGDLFGFKVVPASGFPAFGIADLYEVDSLRFSIVSNHLSYGEINAARVTWEFLDCSAAVKNVSFNQVNGDYSLTAAAGSVDNSLSEIDQQISAGTDRKIVLDGVGSQLNVQIDTTNNFGGFGVYTNDSKNWFGMTRDFAGWVGHKRFTMSDAAGFGAPDSMHFDFNPADKLVSAYRTYNDRGTDKTFYVNQIDARGQYPSFNVWENWSAPGVNFQLDVDTIYGLSLNFFPNADGRGRVSLGNWGEHINDFSVHALQSYFNLDNSFAVDMGAGAALNGDSVTLGVAVYGDSAAYAENRESFNVSWFDAGISNFRQEFTVRDNGIEFNFKEYAANKGRITNSTLTDYRIWTMPDNTGTVALTSDLPDLTPPAWDVFNGLVNDTLDLLARDQFNYYSNLSSGDTLYLPAPTDDYIKTLYFEQSDVVVSTVSGVPLNGANPNPLSIGRGGTVMLKRVADFPDRWQTIGGASYDHSLFSLVYNGAQVQALNTTPRRLDSFTTEKATGFITTDSTATKSGATPVHQYFFNLSTSFESSVSNVVVTCEIFVGTTAQQFAGFERKVGSAGDVGSANLSGILGLAGGEEISCRCAVDAGTANITFDRFSFSAFRIDD